MKLPLQVRTDARVAECRGSMGLLDRQFGPLNHSARPRQASIPRVRYDAVCSGPVPSQCPILPLTSRPQCSEGGVVPDPLVPSRSIGVRNEHTPFANVQIRPASL